MSCRKPFLYRVKQLKGRARWLWAHQRHTSGTPASLDYSDGALRGVSTRGCGYITRTRRLESAVTAGPKGLIAQEYGIHVLAAVVRRVGMRSGQAEDRLLIVFDSERKKTFDSSPRADRRASAGPPGTLGFQRDYRSADIHARTEQGEESVWAIGAKGDRDEKAQRR